MKAYRWVAASTALLSAAALGLQMGLIVQSMTAGGSSAAEAAWRFLGYFTILTNIGVTAVAAAMAWRPESLLAGPRVRLVAATAIALVGIVYTLLLRAIWDPSGWQAVADHTLHDVMPPLFVLAWALAPHGTLRWADSGWALLPPLAYCIYALGRGAIDGWYAYWFLDPHTLTPVQMTGNMAVLLLGFWAVALALVAVDRRLGHRKAKG
ncbi:Pr6Pr family membrane protein [Chthonobacter albigriseus]|uniref:Pr6Pr family membrane protein n=1 Tax=Chthonobacter albigriseus TaxID=1683161 RepID=UPI0015EEB378|nr:Pr6Pr family membrane protein [Chthonobacter albigriseus]